jgi:hypothetical protein
VRQERFVGALLGVEGLFAQALIGSPPHARRLGRKRRGCSGIAAEALPDLLARRIERLCASSL